MYELPVDIKKAKFDLLEGVSHIGVQNGEGLFDGNVVNEWDTAKVFYFNSSNAYVRLLLHEPARVWRCGTGNWSHRYQGLNIYKIENGVEVDYTDRSVTTTARLLGEWEPFTQVLEPGEYVFGKGFHGSGEYRVDSEWFIGNMFQIKHVFDANSTLLTIGEEFGELKLTEVTAQAPLTVQDIANEGTDDINHLFAKQNTVTSEMGEVREEGEGKVFTKTVTPSEFENMITGVNVL